MLNISVCVGSACHLKGSYDVISVFKEYVEENKLEKNITIKAAFCLGHCTNAVSVKFNEKIYSVEPNSAKEFFENTIMENLV